MKVVEITIETVKGRVPVIAGSGSNSTAETIMLTKIVTMVAREDNYCIFQETITRIIENMELTSDTLLHDRYKILNKLGQGKDLVIIGGQIGHLFAKSCNADVSGRISIFTEAVVDKDCHFRDRSGRGRRYRLE